MAARPYYEQVEVLANSFGDLDAAIDARPYAYPQGEARSPADGTAGVPVPETELNTPGLHFQGYHKIENLLYRDGNIAAAVPEAQRLVTFSQDLVATFNGTREEFSAGKSFEGMIGLATEVAAKKMSSEEETHSDQSVLIYANNFKGIESQAMPFMPQLQAASPRLASRLEGALQYAGAQAGKWSWTDEDGTVVYTPYSALSVQDRKDIQFAAYDLASVLRQTAATLGI